MLSAIFISNFIFFQNKMSTSSSASVFGPAFQSGLLNIVPFWSTQALAFLRLGNEYGMLTTMLFTHLVKNVTVSWVDEDWLKVIFCVVVFMVVVRSTVVRQLLGSFFQLKPGATGARYCLLFEGREEHYPELRRMDLHYPEEIKALNGWILSKPGNENRHFVLTTNARNDQRKEMVMPVTDLVLQRDEMENHEDNQTIYLEVSRHRRSSLFRVPVYAEYDEEGIAKESSDCVLKRSQQDRIIQQSSSPLAVIRSLLFSSSSEEDDGGGEGGGGKKGGGNNAAGNQAEKDVADSSSRLVGQVPVIYVKYTVYMYAPKDDGRFSLWNWLFDRDRKETDEKRRVGKLREFMSRIVEDHRALQKDSDDKKPSELMLSGIDSHQTGEVVFHPGMYAIDAWIARFHPKAKMRCVFQSFVLLERAEQNKKKGADDKGDNEYSSGEMRLKQKKKSRESSSGGGGFGGDAGGNGAGGGDGGNGSKQENQVKVSLALDEDGAVTEIDLDEEVRLTAYRRADCIHYFLKARRQEVDCKKWLEAKILWHADEGDHLFKKSIRMNGMYLPIYSYGNWYGSATATYRIPKLMWCLSWYVDTVVKVSGVLMPADEPEKNSTSLYRFLVDGGRWVKLKDDLFLKTFSDSRSRYGDDINFLSYVLVSNTVDVKSFLEEVEVMFDAWLKEKKKEELQGPKKLWYFKYLGMQGGELRFHQALLSEKGTNNECFMTFDHVYHEHKERIIEEISRLGDLEYYRKFGLNRKIGFTLYGPPGTCKTRSAIACAIKFERHLIDIDLSIVKTKDEFHRLTHLEKIMGVDITDDTSLLLFDEIDVGIEKIYCREKKSDAGTTIVTSLVDDKNKTPTQPNTTDSALNIATLLTVLDPAEPRHGAVWFSCTNNIDKLPEAFRRDMRMTSLYLGELRRVDAAAIIGRYFGGGEFDVDVVKDRFWIPTKLITVCKDNHAKMSLSEFLKTVVVPAQSSC